MKKFFPFVFALALTACLSQPIAQFVPLPDAVKTGITAVIVWAVSFFFAKLIVLIPFLKFLEEFRMPLALAIAVEVINVIQNALLSQYAAAEILALQLILAILALFGVGEVLRVKGIKGFK